MSSQKSFFFRCFLHWKYQYNLMIAGVFFLKFFWCASLSTRRKIKPGLNIIFLRKNEPAKLQNDVTLSDISCHYKLRSLLLCFCNSIFCNTNINSCHLSGDVNILYFLRKEPISAWMRVGLLIPGLKRQQTIFYLVFLSRIY